jgi:membrane dipeptidase
MLLDHIDHMVALIGSDHVGFGTDFLGQTENRPPGFGDIGECGNLVSGLKRRNHDADTIAKLMGMNFMRVFSRVAG